MPLDVSIQALPHLGPAAGPKDDVVAAPAPATPAGTSQAFLNPSLRLDPALGLVVIEFRDSAGTVTNSIPSERQLEAYRRHGQVPAGIADDARADDGSESAPAASSHRQETVHATPAAG